MTKKIYRCRVCGSKFEVLSQGGGGLSCCGAPLNLWRESGGPDFQDKSEALIDLVEVMDNGKSCWQFFQPGESPMAAWMNGGGVEIPNRL
ncbi:MAG: desulfoferrodoxin FeS4 iron-binding domain-containing protein [Deltaproteobacteria bacterium]|nr:desulfoferrodoxin FeS4 iron-binding domain-containing protein [Deltaproteobacteria bacterium]